LTRPPFKVLRTRDIDGTLTLSDFSVYGSGIRAYGGSCTGDGGYSDIGPGTRVTVKNGVGDIIGESVLEEGSGSSVVCTFSFTVTLTEGEDRYIFEIGRRGAISFTFGDLVRNGVSLTLGN
jgi:hypothetical protein